MYFIDFLALRQRLIVSSSTQVRKTALFRRIGKALRAVPFQALLGFLTLLQLVIKNTKVSSSLQPAKQLTMGATAVQVCSD